MGDPIPIPHHFNYSVIPVKTGIQDKENKIWIPASAGMTNLIWMVFMIFQSAKLILSFLNC
jgi:hypothetical protein